MKLTFNILVLLALLSISTEMALAQVATGTPPLGSFGGGQVDTINLANLNAHFNVPVFQKAGRGLPFNFVLTYDTSVWFPVSSGSSSAWTPGTDWGWGSTDVSLGYMTNIIAEEVEHNGSSTTYQYTYSHWTFWDGIGTPHLFPGRSIWTEVCNNKGCTSSYLGFNATASDNSGYVIRVTGYTVNSLVARSGMALIANSQWVATYAQDSNGNQLSWNSNGTGLTDTLGTTALTVAGSGTPSSPVTYTYPAPSGANAVYTVKYTSETVRTNFGCSGIAEFGPTSENLVSEIDLPDGTKYTFAYESTPSYSGDVTGRLASVTLPTGGTISYSYSSGSNGITCADGSTATLTRYTPDTGSNYWTYAHTESGTAWSTTVTDPQGNQTAMSFQGIYQTERQNYQGSTSSGTLLKTSYTCYNGAASPCNSTAITLPISSRTHIVQWPGSSGLQSKTVTSYNTYGLVAEKDEYAYGVGAPGSVVRKTLTSYASLGNGIVNRPAQVTLEDGSGNIKSQTTYTYDQGSVTATSGTPQHVSISGSRGNPTTVSYLVSGSTTLNKTLTYFDTGNPYVATDVNGAQTTYTYGACGNSFATSISEPLSLSKSMAWNCTGGVETSITDENSQTMSTSYTDAYFWRPNSTTDQLSNVTNLTYTNQTSVESSLVFNGSSSTSDILKTVDGLSRSHLAQTKESPSSSTYDSVETDYDSNGRPNRTTLPFSGTAGQTSSSAPGTSTTYDALSRKSQVTDSGGGSITYTYTQNDTYRSAGPAASGENAKRKQLEYDALGRLTSVCEITNATGSGTCSQTSPATGYWTKYTYDLNNKLTGVTQNAQSGSTQTRTYAYDGLGRMTSETNPESGTTTYSYDSPTSTCTNSAWNANAPGHLVQKQDANGNVTCYLYDALGRIGEIFVGAGPGQWGNSGCELFFYDNSLGLLGSRPSGVATNNSLGRLVEAATQNCSWPPTQSSISTDEWFSYTARGEVSDLWESTPHSGGYYHAGANYWANGALNQLTGAQGYYQSYGLDGKGRVYSTTDGSGSHPLASTLYNSASLPTQVNFGYSGDSDSYSYDPNTNRMTQYQFNVNGQSVTGNLNWNAVGTLSSLGITDPFNSSNTQTCSYSHDDLVRLASANCGSIWSQTFTYDAFGNINKSGSMSFGATYSPTTNRMTSIGSSTPSYDADGNVLNDFLNTYSWDGYGRPVTINGVGVTYDALGRMVEQNRSGAYIQVLYAPTGFKMQLINGQTNTSFVQLPGGAVAVWGPNGFYYRHADWLGSSRFASTALRTMYYDGAYAPFGEPYAQTGTTDLSFTGMNQDTSANVYDFPAREYGIQGRWPSPDPSGISSVHIKDPQMWNRYAYIRNSPLDEVDPTGLQGVICKWCQRIAQAWSGTGGTVFGGGGFGGGGASGSWGPGAPSDSSIDAPLIDGGTQTITVNGGPLGQIDTEAPSIDSTLTPPDDNVDSAGNAATTQNTVDSANQDTAALVATGQGATGAGAYGAAQGYDALAGAANAWAANNAELLYNAGTVLNGVQEGLDVTTALAAPASTLEAVGEVVGAAITILF